MIMASAVCWGWALCFFLLSGPAAKDFASAATATAPRESAVVWPLLFMDVSDVSDMWGLIQPRASPVELATDLSPPSLNYRGGAVVFGAIASASQAGVFELYAANTTGFEPISGQQQSQHASQRDWAARKFTVEVMRFTTQDFRAYSLPSVCLTFSSGGDPNPYTLPTVKSVVRNTRSNETIMVVYDGGIKVFRSADEGISFHPSRF